MLYLFNTNIIPNECIARITQISTQKAVEIVNSTPAEQIKSAIGHQGSVDALATIGINTQINRVFANPEPFDMAVSLKLNGRLEEGRILDMAAMNEIGYSMYLIEFFPIELCIVNPCHVVEHGYLL